MIRKVISKIVIIAIVATMIIATVGQTMVKAKDTSNSINIGLSSERLIKNGTGYDEGGAYTLNTGNNSHPIYQIVKINSENKTDGTNFLCLNAVVGDSWHESGAGARVDYNTSYDLANETVWNDTTLVADAYKNVLGANGEKKNKIMWLLDNFLLGTDYTEDDVDEFLAKAGIVKGNVDMASGTIETYYFDVSKYLEDDTENSPIKAMHSNNPFADTNTDLNLHLYGNTNTGAGYCYEKNGTQKKVRLSKDLIEAVEQAVIWYFTNGDTNPEDFDWYTPKSNNVTSPRAFLFEPDGTALVHKTDDGTEEGAPTGAMLQEQASILYNYLIDAANHYGPNYEFQEGTLNLDFGNSAENKIEDVGEYYKVGPLKVTTTGNTTINGVNVTSGTSTTPISGVTLQNESGTTISKPRAGENFYCMVPKQSVTGAIKVEVTAKVKYVDKKLWIKTGNNQVEQPIVEVTPTTRDLKKDKSVTLGNQFDLALRKRIVAINGNSTENDIKNEAGDSAVRATNNIDTNLIPDTARYNHRKDPVVVKKGDTVTYRIWIYNEGDINGYASKIVDQLPTGMVSTLGTTVTSNKGTTYNVSYDETNNKITLTADASTAKTINKFNNEQTPPSDYVDVTCRINQEPASNGETHYLTNIAYIAEGFDTESNEPVTADRNGNESKTTESPTQTASQLNSTDANSYKGKNENPSVYNDTDNKTYFEGLEDDDDFEKVAVMPKQFDLALRKFITKINDQNITDRVPVIGTWKFDNNNTLEKSHPKTKIKVKSGDTVVYTIRVYNEGDIDGYASEVTDYLPAGLSIKANSEINTQYGWTANGQTIKTNYLSKENGTDKLLTAIDETADGGLSLNYKDLQVECTVNANATSDNLKNIAAITGATDPEGNPITDRDSQPEPVNPDTYNPDTTTQDKGRGEQDDDDFEDLRLATVDLALTKFITAVSEDTKIEDGEYLTPNKRIGTKTNEYIRATVADTTGLKNGSSHNATYSARKDIEPLAVSKNSYILYNIRVYNEGEVDVYAGKITDYLPENLEFVDGEFNKQYGWTANGQTVETTYLSSSNGADKILKAFDKENDDGKGSGMDYKDLPVLCKVSDKAESGKKMVNTAEITKYEDENGNEIPKDIDSTPENKEEKNVENRQEDDDDYEVVLIKDFDLALRKFITEIGGKEIDSRIPTPSYENEKITYNHPKDVIRTTVGDIVTYTLRVYNEGDFAGFAQEIADDIPEHLEFLPENATNRTYKWVMYDENGNSTTKVSDAVRIKTDYTSKSNGELLMKEDESLKENPNLLKAFDKSAGITDTNPDYVDVKVAFKVKDPKSNKTVIVNKAQITEDADENGNPVVDVDSTPDEWNEGEDDQDYENVAVDYFDLSLLKYVTKTIVTENGKTKTTKTGNNGSSKDITPKVEVYRRSVNKTIVKFEYTIKITNEGDIAGYAKEITDYVPKGLKFFKEDNKGWKDEGNNVISTKLLKDTLLQPGQSATVKVILRWVNGENNLGIKTNVAEISKDYNEKGAPDKDSTPDNKKKGEDDIDDAPVLLTISTGMLEHTMQYVTAALVILVVLGTGIVVIKKYVL